MNKNGKLLGQVWTPKFIVDKMVNLITKQEPNLILETSSGCGNFYYELIKKYKNVIALEIDKNIAHKEAIICSYFDTNYKPDVIIGNPPYIDFKNIKIKPKSDMLIHKPNLFLFFLEKALSDLKDDGELIWIIPSNVFTNSSSKKLNEMIYNNFSITHWEIINENVWDNASISTAIVKIVKRKNDNDKLNYLLKNGKIIFGSTVKTKLKVVVKVGGASGFNNNLEEGNTEFINSKTERTGATCFIKYEPKKWIRPTPKPPIGFTYQIFVNCKTRKNKPFYILDNLHKGEFINYDASVLCLYLFCTKEEQLKFLNILNSYDWEKIGIKKDGRFHFSQSILGAIIE